MRLSRKVLAIVGASTLLVGTVAAPAMADSTVPIYGGRTEITTTAKVLHNLTAAGILMKGTNGASSVIIRKGGEARQQFTFSVTTPSKLTLEDNPIGGTVGAVTGGKVTHTGTIRVLNTNNGKVMKFGDFVVNFDRMKVFARSINGDMVDPVAVFVVKVFDPPLVPTYNDKTAPTKARVAGIGIHLTRGAASLLNGELNSKVFEGGMMFGKVVTVADLVK